MALREKIPAPLHGLARTSYARIGQATPGLRMLPSFVVIGGQRCGTTTIFKHLTEHPQVFRPGVEKGIDFFSLHYDRDIDWYRGHFPIERVARRRTGGLGAPQAFEACTYYMFHPFAVERLVHDVPDVKLVAMLRDPAERAFSAYKHELARGFETETSFERALDLEDERLEGEEEKMAADTAYESHAHRHQAYRRRGQYAEQLRRVLSLVPRERLHVLDSESFFADPAQEYSRVTDFLGLTAWQPGRFEQHNARPSRPMPEHLRRRLDEHYLPHDEELTRLLGRPPGWRR